MIIRRIADALRTQNWFTVIIEILIVVLGVFIGIQVANWNDERRARGEEQQYLARLQSDISSSIGANRGIIGFMSSQVENNSFVMASLKGCNLPEGQKDRFATALVNIGKIIPTQLSRSTIDELVSSGKFRYLSSEVLRKVITEHLETIAAEQSIMSALALRGTPHVVYIESNVNFNLSQPGTGKVSVSWDNIDIDFQALCSDPRFYNAISVTSRYLNDVIASVQTGLQQQTELLALIKGELK